MSAHGSPHPSSRALNWVWSINLLDWTTMIQPTLNAGTVTADFTGTGLAKDTTALSIDTNTKTYDNIYDYNGGTTIIYAGSATPGSATSAAVWRIRKFTYDGNSNITYMPFTASGAFTRIWDNRAGYSYP